MTTESVSGAATCYRHPRREAPLSCTRCQRPICLDDAIDAPVGFLCPECAQQPARVRRAARASGEPATRALLGAIVVVFLAQQASDAVFQNGALFGPAVAAGEWWRVVTAGFLHSRSILHIGFNGYLLWLLGRMLEPQIGTNRFLALFSAGLLGGSLGALLLSWDAATIGASGAVFGLMGAAMVGLRRRGVNPWRTSIGTLVALNLVLTFVISGISIGGHVGGLAGGALAGFAVFHLEGEQRTLGTTVAWGIAGALGIAAVLAGTLGPIL